MKPFREFGLFRGVLRERADEHRWMIEARGLDAARQELAGVVDELVERDPATAKRLLMAAVDLLAEQGGPDQGV